MAISGNLRVAATLASYHQHSFRRSTPSSKALSDFVEIESKDKVQLSVSTDSDLGTIYSVTVPVRRRQNIKMQMKLEPSQISSTKILENGLVLWMSGLISMFQMNKHRFLGLEGKHLHSAGI